MTISRNRLLPAVFCASIASLLALGTASAAHAGAGTPYASIQIQNNFASSLANAPKYFGQGLTDDQIWLYLQADPGKLTYMNSTTHTVKNFILGHWVQLSQIQNGIINADVGLRNAVMYAVISQTQPSTPPLPTPPCIGNTCGTTDLAYAALEWNFHNVGYENADLQNIDQFSFTNRMTVKNSTGTPLARKGFSGSTSSQAILEQIRTNYGGGSCQYPGATFPANYPLPTPPCQLPTGCDVPSYTCNGLPQDYLTNVNMNRMTQKIDVVTGIPALDIAEAYRWVGSSKSTNSAIPGYYVNVWQGFGKTFEPYLTALFNNHQQNASGYYADYSGSWKEAPLGHSGFSFIFKVTQGANGIGHGIEISNIRLNTLQSGAASDSSSKVKRNAGAPLVGTITILANGEPILNTGLSGCATVNPFSQYSGCPGGAPCCTPVTNANPAMNSYGLWTDAALTTGAAVFGCNGELGIGPVITASADFGLPEGDERQGLLAVIQGEISAVLNFGIITPSWNPVDGAPGTNNVFAAATQLNQASLLFQAGSENADVWTQTLWQYQDFSLVPNSQGVYSAPLYLCSYSDRFQGSMKPGADIPRNGTILWELGVPMSISSTACRADFQHSGSVDGADLSTLLNAWGQCSGTCVADLNNDNAVDGADLAILLNAWGPCPV